MKGISGAQAIKDLMEKLRNDPPSELGGIRVTRVSDYMTDDTKIKLPKSNVLYFDMDDNAWCCARPSGTEPKIKFYFGVKGTSLTDADEKLDKVKNALMSLVG